MGGCGKHRRPCGGQASESRGDFPVALRLRGAHHQQELGEGRERENKRKRGSQRGGGSEGDRENAGKRKRKKEGKRRERKKGEERGDSVQRERDFSLPQ